jgi:sugar phosphate isomerase/epimerase
VARVGLMLYSVREACAEDFEGTLRRVGEYGFEGVELFDLHGERPVDVAAWLDENGLVAIARHSSLEAIEDNLPELAEEARALGWRRVIVAWIDPAKLDDPALPGRLEAAATAASRFGLELGYHNHDAEIRSGFLDRLPEDVFVELDLGWTWWADADPVEVLERLGPRCKLVHVKDFRTRGERSFCPVGDGSVGYDRVAPAAERSGVDWLIVEQDEADGSELDAAERSLGALRRMLEPAA